MDDLITFLRARLDEAEHRVHHGNDTHEGHDWHTAHCGWEKGEGISDECDCDVPKLVLADVDAKRQIFDWCEYMLFQDDRGIDVVADRTLRLLALPFAGHPDYLEAWRP